MVGGEAAAAKKKHCGNVEISMECGQSFMDSCVCAGACSKIALIIIFSLFLVFFHAF
jgi:hypothetical protein